MCASLDKRQKGIERKYALFALRIAGHFGIAIAAPVVICVLLGQYADRRLNTGPMFTIVAFVMSAIISGVIIYRKAKQYGKEFSSLDAEKKEENDI